MPNESTDTQAPARVDMALLVRSHQRLVARVLTRAGVAARDVPDLLQEVFIVAHRRLPEWQGRAKLSTWLYRVALRVASDHRRRAYQRRELLPGLDTASLPAEPELPAIERREQVMQLYAAVEQLSEEHKQALLGYEIEELTVAELAERTHVPHKTVYSRLYAARRLLRQLLLAQGWTLIASLMSRPRRCLAAARAWAVSPAHSLLVASCLLLASPALTPLPLPAAKPAVHSQALETSPLVATTLQLPAAKPVPETSPKKKRVATRKRATPTLALPAPHAELRVIHVGAFERPEGPLPFGFERIEEPPTPRITMRGPRDAADALVRELAW